MHKKTAIITGGTSGVGYSIARELTKRNYCVYVIGSNKDSGLIVEKQLKSFGNQDVFFVQLDLSDLQAVKNFADQFKQQHNTLDILLNVAGVVLPSKQITKQGFEKTFTIGYLSAFILSTELAPLLENGNNPRILNVSGDVGFALKSRINFDNLNWEKNYNGFKAAITAIHAKTVLTSVLSEKFAGKNISVVSFHPGIVKSRLTHNLPTILNFFVGLVQPFMANESKTGILLSTMDDVKPYNGKLLVKKKVLDLHFDKTYKMRLVEESEKMILAAQGL